MVARRSCIASCPGRDIPRSSRQAPVPTPATPPASRPSPYNLPARCKSTCAESWWMSSSPTITAYPSRTSRAPTSASSRTASRRPCVPLSSTSRRHSRRSPSPTSLRIPSPISRRYPERPGHRHSVRPAQHSAGVAGVCSRQLLNFLRHRQSSSQVAIFVLTDKLHMLQGFTETTTSSSPRSTARTGSVQVIAVAVARRSHAAERQPLPHRRQPERRRRRQECILPASLHHAQAHGDHRIQRPARSARAHHR